MIDKINEWREKLGNKYVRAIVFFAFYVFFFGFVFLLMTHTSTGKKDTVDKTSTDKWVLLDNNYEYLYQISTNDAKGIALNITLLGKRYVNKDVYNKYVNTVLESTIYTFYNNAYLKQNNTWVKQDNFVKVYPGFDDNLISVDYIKDIKKKATLVNTLHNFDGTIEEDYKYATETDGEMILNVTSKDTAINKIEIKVSNIDIVLQYKNINKVQDFVVEKEGK